MFFNIKRLAKCFRVNDVYRRARINVSRHQQRIETQNLIRHAHTVDSLNRSNLFISVSDKFARFFSVEIYLTDHQAFDLMLNRMRNTSQQRRRKC